MKILLNNANQYLYLQISEETGIPSTYIMDILIDRHVNGYFKNLDDLLSRVSLPIKYVEVAEKIFVYTPLSAFKYPDKYPEYSLVKKDIIFDGDIIHYQGELIKHFSSKDDRFIKNNKLQINTATEREFMLFLDLTKQLAVNIVSERNKNGPYKDINDFVTRLKLRESDYNIDMSFFPPELKPTPLPASFLDLLILQIKSGWEFEETNIRIIDL